MKFLLASLCVVTGCSHIRPVTAEPEKHEVKFDEVLITGDLALEKLNDEELFAAGTSFFASEDFAQAARYFGRLADFHPKSIHRRAALYNAGLALEKLKMWEDAHQRFQELSDPAKGTGDALDAAFRVAETLYHLARFEEAVVVLKTIGGREDLPLNKRMEARVQQGVCELENGQSDVAEATLRKVIETLGETRIWSTTTSRPRPSSSWARSTACTTRA
jgi:TolA-binding protein